MFIPYFKLKGKNKFSASSLHDIFIYKSVLIFAVSPVNSRQHITHSLNASKKSREITVTTTDLGKTKCIPVRESEVRTRKGL